MNSSQASLYVRYALSVVGHLLTYLRAKGKPTTDFFVCFVFCPVRFVIYFVHPICFVLLGSRGVCFVVFVAVLPASSSSSSSSASFFFPGFSVLPKKTRGKAMLVLRGLELPSLFREYFRIVVFVFVLFVSVFVVIPLLLLGFFLLLRLLRLALENTEKKWCYF